MNALSFPDEQTNRILKAMQYPLPHTNKRPFSSYILVISSARARIRPDI